MTVAATITAVQYTANGSATQFSFNNKIFAASDIVVTLFDLSGNSYSFINQGSGTLGLSYTVQNVDVDTGCLVVFSAPPTLNWIVDIRTDTPELQSTSIKNQGAFLPELHEEAFDKLTRIVQDDYRQTYTFGIHGPDTETVPWNPLPGVQARKGMALMFDAVTGSPTLGVPVTQTITTGLLAQFLNLTQTPAEAAAGSVPVNLFYLPGHVDRYGTNVVPGTTSMTAAFQAAINQARAGGADIVWGETAPYVLDAPLDCTNSNNGLSFRQYFPQSMNPSPPGSVEEGAIIVKHNGYAVFDLAGTQMATFHDMSLVTSNTVYPKTCFFLARGTASNGAFARILNTNIQGYFSVAILYNYASELGIYSNNNWWNEAADVGANVVVMTSNNNYRGTANFITSPFATIPSGTPQSCLSHEFRGGSFVMEHASSTSNLFYLEGFVARCRLHDFWCGLSNTDGVTHGNAIVYCDPSAIVASASACAGYTEIRSVHVETSITQPLYGVRIAPAGVATAAGSWIVADSFFNDTTFDFYLDSSVSISGWRIQGMNAPSGLTGFNAGGLVTDSFLDFSGVITVTGLSQRNLYRTAVSGLTRGSHAGDVIIDHFAAAGSMRVDGTIGMSGNAPPGQSAGWGTPVGGVAINNYNITDAGGANSNTNKAVAQIITMLKSMGLLGV